MDKLYFLIVGAVVAYAAINYMLHKVEYYYDGEEQEQAHDDKT